MKLKQIEVHGTQILHPKDRVHLSLTGIASIDIMRAKKKGRHLYSSQVKSQFNASTMIMTVLSQLGYLRRNLSILHTLLALELGLSLLYLLSLSFTVIRT